MILLKKQKKKLRSIEELYMDGVITNGERYNKVISIWGHATAEVAAEMTKSLEKQDKEAFEMKIKHLNHLTLFL